MALDISAFKWATSKQAFAGHVAKRNVVMKPLEYNADGTIKPVDNTPSLVKHKPPDNAPRQNIQKYTKQTYQDK